MKLMNKNSNPNNLIAEENSFGFQPTKVLLDASLLFSIFIDRQCSYKQTASVLMNLIVLKKIIGFITNIDYDYLRKLAHICMEDRADSLLSFINYNFLIHEVNKQCIEDASKYPFNQLDTAIALVCAQEKGINVIITETPEAFVGKSEVLILTPEEFISRYSFETNSIQPDGLISSYVSSPISEPERLNPLPEENLREIINGWQIEHFEVHISAADAARAELSLWNKSDGRKITKHAYGNGPADALFRALALAVFIAEPTYYLPLPIINHIFLESEQLGSDSPVNAKITVDVKGQFYTGKFVSTDTVKAVFYAYLAAIRESRLIGDSQRKIVSAELLKERYRDGNRSFSEVTLTNLSLNDLHLEGINLEGSTITVSDLRRTVFSCQGRNANLKKAKIDLSGLDNADFSYADLNDVEIVGTKMVGTIFHHADLSDAVIRGSELHKAKMNEAKLARATLSACSLKGAELNHACLDQAILSGVDLTEAALQIASLIRAVLNNACLNRAILTRANLTGANFSRAKLVSADLRGSTLLKTTFANADLSKANLEGLDLTKADLTGAVLDYAKLGKARLHCNQVDQLGGYSENVNLNQAIIEASPSSEESELPECCLGLS
jgi:uncharacterized protein YjbI with pentapeptide repeats